MRKHELHRNFLRYYDQVLPRMPVAAKRALENTLILLPQYRERSKLNKRIAEDFFSAKARELAWIGVGSKVGALHKFSDAVLCGSIRLCAASFRWPAFPSTYNEVIVVAVAAHRRSLWHAGRGVFERGLDQRHRDTKPRNPRCFDTA